MLAQILLPEMRKEKFLKRKAKVGCVRTQFKSH
jgi:hypothetical protein